MNPEFLHLLATKLRKGGYIYIDLSEEMKDAGKRAYEEIERTIALSYPFKAIRFMIGGKLSESESLD